MMHILNLIYQFEIQHYSHSLRKIPPPPWFGIFANNLTSPNLPNIVESKIDESDLICTPCAPICSLQKNVYERGEPFLAITSKCMLYMHMLLELVLRMHGTI
jgi:hypothetical protein